MPRQPVEVTPPASPVYRVAHGPDPFTPRVWEHAHEDGTFGNRFDDPGALSDPSGRRDVIPIERRFRTLYLASESAGAFGETIARFRASPRLLAGLASVDDDEPIDPSLRGGEVPAAWRIQRLMGITRLEPGLRFVDLAAPETRVWLTHELATLLTALEIADLDLSAVMDQRQRRLTQEIARFVYEQTDAVTGAPRFTGVRYLSRLNSDWELWAVYADRLIHVPAPSQSIFPDDPGLLDACRRLGLAPPRPFE